jgi:hypothetical protein
MKNIHVLPTEKPSRLVLETINNNLFLTTTTEFPSKIMVFKNIYITSDEEIKPNTYCLINGVLCKTEIREGKIVSRQLTGGATMDICKSEYLEIILTTDDRLIADGVQAIDDEFLEWFVKNPSCEFVEVKKGFEDGTAWGYNFLDYKIIIPQEETKEDKWDKLNKELDDALEEAFGTSPSNILDVFENAKLVLREHLIANKEEVVKDLEQMREWSNTNKQETLEEGFDRIYKELDFSEFDFASFKLGVKWQSERMYSEEEVDKLLDTLLHNNMCSVAGDELIKQFKKK